MPVPLASRPVADHFQTGDTDVPMRQRDCPGCLSADVRRVADVPGRKHLRSGASLSLAIPATDVLQLVIAPSSSQPPLSGTSFLKKSDVPPVFRRRLKTHLFDCV